MSGISRHPTRSARHLMTLGYTGLGLILATAASQASAGWDCETGENGEWLCQAPTGSIVAPPAVTTAPAIAPATAAAAPTTTASPATANTPVSAGTLPASTAAGNETANAADSPLPRAQSLSSDWVPQGKLPKNLRDQRENALCCGAYVDPLDNDQNSRPAADTTLRAHADKSETNTTTMETRLNGDIEVRQGRRYLRADSAVLKKNPQQASLSGHVEVREPGMLLLADRADLQLEENTAELGQVQYLMHKQHIHGSAESLSRSDTGVISLIDATYSYCPVDNRQWMLDAGSLTLDPNNSQGKARNVTLKVKDVPVFYLPYMQFPIGDQRMSGFLVPSFGTGRNGADIATPYYFNLAPNSDLVMTPRYLSDRGLILGGDFRHMSENTTSSVTANVLQNDNVTGDDRWAMKIKQDGSGEHWNSNIDIAGVSDDNYFHDFNNSGLRIGNTSQLRKDARLSYLPDNWQLGGEVKNYQTLDRTVLQPHDVMPATFANGHYNFDNGFDVVLRNEVTRFDHKDAGDNLALDPRFSQIFFDIDHADQTVRGGERFNTDYSIAYPIRNDAAFVTPKVAVRHVSQQLDTFAGDAPGLNSSPSITVPVVSIDSGLLFDRDTEWFGKAYRQTLEPRLFYYHASKQDQDDIYNFDSNELSPSYSQLFHDKRLAGGDYIEDANQVSAGVSTRLLNPTTGREILRASVGQAFYLSKRDIVLENDPATAAYEKNRARSSMVGEIDAFLNQRWTAHLAELWNDDKNRSDRDSAALQYRDGDGTLFNVGYQYLHRDPSPDDTGKIVNRDVEQAYTSASLPLNRKWNAIAHWNYDLTNNRDLETIAGVEYNSCCWNLRLVARRWVINDRFVDNIDQQKTDNGIFLQFQLKSLGGFGDNLDNTLSDSIIGFEKRNKPLD